MAASPKHYSAFAILRTDIDDVLDPAYQRKEGFERFLEGLQISRITAGEFERIIAGGHFPPGSAYVGARALVRTADLYGSLSVSEKAQLREHYFAKLNSTKGEFPELTVEFDEQFR
jgi:hypothetical protein